MATIGIDLGTTYSCVASYRNNRADVVLNHMGQQVTPSVVAFTDSECLVGLSAVDQTEYNAPNTLFDVKRFIGRITADSTLRQACEKWPFHVDLTGQSPKLHVQYKGEPRKFSPEQISAMLLSDLKASAKTYLQENIRGAVVTVPAYFNDQQRRATQAACALAKLENVRILNEPTAAALAYKLEGRLRNGSKILVYDLGGGTFDLCIMEMQDSIFDVKHTFGDSYLGGRDFDNRLVDHVRKQFEQLHNCDITNNSAALARLRKACEFAKLRLSVAQTASVKLPHFLDNISLSTTVDRATFETLNEDLFQRTVCLTEQALKEAGINRKTIDEVILVGGSTRIPRIRALLREFFHGKSLNSELNPDLVVAQGAAVYAAKLFTPTTAVGLSNWVIRDVSAFSIGVEDCNGRMVAIIERNSLLPAEGIHYATTSVDRQADMYVAVYEGENPTATSNRLLDYFTFAAIARVPAGQPIVRIQFALNSEGILNVTTTNVSNGSTQSLVTRVSGNKPTSSVSRNSMAELFLTKMKSSQHI